MIPGIEAQVEFASFETTSKLVSSVVEEQIIQEASSSPSIEQQVWALLAARYNHAQIMQEIGCSHGKLKELLVQMKATAGNPKMSYVQLMDYAVKYKLVEND